MEIMKILYAVLGITQGIIGVLSGILTLLLGLGFVEIQTLLTLPPEFLSLYLLILGLFSAFSILNALFLVRRWRS